MSERNEGSAAASDKPDERKRLRRMPLDDWTKLDVRALLQSIYCVPGEPTPPELDAILAEFREFDGDALLGKFDAKPDFNVEVWLRGKGLSEAKASQATHAIITARRLVQTEPAASGAAGGSSSSSAAASAGGGAGGGASIAGETEQQFWVEFQELARVLAVSTEASEGASSALGGAGRTEDAGDAHVGASAVGGAGAGASVHETEEAHSPRLSPVFVSLPTSSFFGASSDMGSAYMRRECYAHLKRIVEDAWMASRRKTPMVFGAPGIGKSTFLLELMLDAVREGRTVVHAVTRTKGITTLYYLYRPGEAVLESRAIFDAIKNAETLLLCDSSEVPPEARCRVVVASSSGGTRQFEGVHDRVVLYMPPWSLEELHACREKLYPETLSAELVNAQYALWGGSARYVLRYPTSASRKLWDESAMNAALSRAGSPEELLRAVARGDQPDNVAHKLIHPIPVNDGTYESVAYDLCSSYVTAVLEARMHDNIAANSAVLHTFFLGMADSSNAYIVAHIFEAYAIRRLSEGGKFVALKLGATEDDPSRTIVFQISKRPTVRFRTLDDEKVATLADDHALLAPLTSNYGSIDALTKAGVFFQMTVATSHSVKAAPVRAYCKSLNITTLSNAKVVFVVPKGKRDAWTTPQKWLNANGEELTGIRLPGQYIMEL